MTKSLDATQFRRLFTVDELAKIINCSPRHVRRMADAGDMPQPRHLGRLVRWDALEIQTWLDNGCPKVRTLKTGRGA